VPPDSVIPILDRYLMFYIRTADKLQRTARWLEALPGGIAYLRTVILEDKLGICAALEAQMEALVGSFFDEWAEAIANPEMAAKFKQFANTDATVENTEMMTERGQSRPVDWSKESASVDFRATKWSSLAWQPLIRAAHFEGADAAPSGVSANVKRGDTQLALFRVKGKYYATQQMCPHKRAFVLSDGLIGDDPSTNKLWVSCPLHKRNFELEGGDGAAGGVGEEDKSSAGKCTNDSSVSIATFPVEEREDGWVYVKLPPVEELDGVLGTKRWMVKAGEAGDSPFEKLDRKIAWKGIRKRARRPDEIRNAVVKVGGGGGEGIDW
jgi:nitrite reductase (NAD(P)H)